MKDSAQEAPLHFSVRWQWRWWLDFWRSGFDSDIQWYDVR